MIRIPHALLLATLLAAGPVAAQADDEAPAVDNVEEAPAEEGEEATDEDALSEATEAEASSEPSPEELEEGGLIRPQALRPGDEAAFASFEEALGEFESEMGDYRRSVAEVVELEYRRERERRLDFYNDNIEVLRIDERGRRLQAIADFEQFLDRFPDHPEYSPDVLFRLAELHYEKAVDEYNQDDVNFELALERYELGIDPDPPAEPAKDFSTTVRLFERLINGFPEYRQIDGAYYLMSICHDQMDELDEAFAGLETLVTDYPDSDFAQESYLRLGEFNFDDARFELALSAYESALSYGESNWYDKILFKLGWSTYLLNDYDLAINYFTDLLNWYDREEAAGGAALKEEALQYFAISIAEEDWDLDGERDLEFVMPRVGQYLGEDLEYTSEVLDRLSGILMENTRYEYSIEVNQHAISRFECDPRNIDRALQMVEAYSQLREFDQALAMQRDLSTSFGPGSEWYACMERLGEMDAVAQAEAVVKENLIETAARYYLLAEQTMSSAYSADDPALLDQAAEEFSFAANIYGDFLEAYPDDPLSYEMRMYYAQALLYGNRYAEAAVAFADVRDSLISQDFMELSAALAVQSYEYALDDEINAFVLEGRAWPAYNGPNEWLPPEDFEDEEESDEPRELPGPEEIPALSLEWVTAIQAYLDMGLTSDDDPAIRGRYGYQLAKLLYDYQHYADSRAGFMAVLDDCNSDLPETGFAAGFILNTYTKLQDASGALSFRDALPSYQSCIEPDVYVALVADMERMNMGIIAASAEALVAEGKYEEAAEEYARLSDEYRDNREMAPLGLWNSGLIYEQELRRYERAMAQFEALIREFPESEYVDDAHVRIAINAKRFFDFDRAVDEFLILDEMGFSDPELVEHPILDAAILMQSMGRRAEAAEAYLQFAEDFPNDGRAASAMFSAGVLYDELDNHRGMRDVFSDFRARYGNSVSTDLINIDVAVIDTFRRSADAYTADGRPRDADDELEDLLAEYSLRLPSGTQAVLAHYAAAGVIYDDAVDSFEEWDSIEMGEEVEEQQEALAERIAGIEPVVFEFRAVADYNSAERTTCAYYMEGRVFQAMADLLYDLPIPDFGDSWEAEDEYVLMVEDFASQYEDQAVAAWQVAYPLMQQLGVTNQCTIDMTAQLNRYRGSDYPVFREALDYEEERIFSPQLRALPVVEDDGPADMDLDFGDDDE
jgi:TolA-binding protein